RMKDAGEGGNPKDAHDKQDRNRASAEDQKRTLDELNRLSKALKSDDPKTREEAQRKLDELAERAAKQLGQEQLQKDLESKDPAVRQKAQEKLQQELAKHVAKQLGQHQLQKELESSDPAVRQKAMEKLADAMRQQREKEQQ